MSRKTSKKSGAKKTAKGKENKRDNQNQKKKRKEAFDLQNLTDEKTSEEEFQEDCPNFKDDHRKEKVGDDGLTARQRYCAELLTAFQFLDVIKSYGQVAKAINVSRQTIYNWLGLEAFQLQMQKIARRDAARFSAAVDRSFIRKTIIVADDRRFKLFKQYFEGWIPVEKEVKEQIKEHIQFEVVRPSKEKPKKKAKKKPSKKAKK